MTTPAKQADAFHFADRARSSAIDAAGTCN
jgi:hypothetical protein